MISASRADAPSLAATRNSTLPLPCPEAGDNPEIQGAALEASHAHSGCVVTENLAAPPLASTANGLASDTWHLTGSGPIGVVVEDALQPPLTVAATRTTAATRDGQRLARTRFDTTVSSIREFRRSLVKPRRPCSPSSKSYSSEQPALANTSRAGQGHAGDAAGPPAVGWAYGGLFQLAILFGGCITATIASQRTGRPLAHFSARTLYVDAPRGRARFLNAHHLDPYRLLDSHEFPTAF